MQENRNYEKDCVRYLLGELSEEEQTQFEEAYFADDSLFERFLVAKENLVDSYARGDLRGAERERFEQHFLASEPRRQRVSEAKELIRSATAAATKHAAIEALPNVPAASGSWWQSIFGTVGLRPLAFRAALAAFLVIALLGSWLVIRNVRNQQADRERQQNEEAARRRKEEEDAKLTKNPVNDNRIDLPGNKTPPNNSTRASNEQTANKESRQPTSTQVATLFLLPFSSRDGSNSNTLALRSDTRIVMLHLAFKKDDYRRYDVSLRTVDGREVLSRRGPKVRSDAKGKNLTLTLSPAIFRQQDYIVTLSGLNADGTLETIGEYYFRVDRSASQSTPPRR